MKNLLIATDLTPRSDRALYRAFKLAADYNYNLHILHVVDEDLPDKIADMVRNDAIESLEEQIRPYKRKIKNKVNIKVAIAKHYEAILSEAEKIKAKVIVLGTQKDITLKEFFIGSTAERVIRSANIPVLVVKSASQKKYKRVLVAIDFSVYSRKCLEFATDFFPNEQIYLVHSYNIPYKHIIGSSYISKKVKRDQNKQFVDKLNNEMSKFLSTIDKNTDNLNIIIKEGPVLARLNNEIKKIKADLFIMGTHGRTGVSRAFLGSVAESMLITTKCDVVLLSAW
ncbi:MAG: universal stress protein [Thermodesulfobacteriota bacterium]